MNYLGIDYGRKRMGLSLADKSLKVAVPLPPSVQNSLADHLNFIGKVIQERNIQTIVIGYPLSHDGSQNERTKEVDQFISGLENRFKLPVYRINEYLSTQQVQFDLQAFGIKKKQSLSKRKSDRASGIEDSRAATLILQDFLDQEDKK